MSSFVKENDFQDEIINLRSLINSKAQDTSKSRDAEYQWTTRIEILEDHINSFKNDNITKKDLEQIEFDFKSKVKELSAAIESI